MEVTTEIKLPEDGELINYLEKNVKFYNHVWRRVYEDFINGVFKNEYGEDLNEYTKMIKSHYNILTRTANSIIRDVKGRLKALLALKKVELTQLEEKLEKQETEVESLNKEVSVLREKAALNCLSERKLKRYRKLKFVLYNKRKSLNIKKDKRKKLAKQIETGRVTLTFGSKKLFSAQFHLEETKYKDFNDWKKAHDFALNHNIFYLGRIDEKNGNQIVQLSPQEDGSFTLRLRKDLPFRKKGEPDFIEVKGLKLKYLKKEVRKAVTSKSKKEGKSPVTCRFHKRENKGWYLQIMIEVKKEEPLQFKSSGVLAVDFNDAMLAVAETNETGNLVDNYIIPLKHHGSGGKALAEIRDVVKSLSEKAYEKGKPVVIEDLDFKKKKARTGKNKKYNKMIHSLDYSRFRECLERACERNRVKCMAVNPAYTSKIGKEKYKERMKLSTHICAALVIGRRAQGYKDSLKKRV